MKIRSGFVSNSSSSSYICDVCGSTESGYDISLYDIGMAECGNGHLLCDSHIVGEWDDFGIFAPNLDGETDDGDSLRDHFPAKYCPLCTMKLFSDKELLRYLLRGLDRQQLEAGIRKQFPTYQEFQKYIYGR